MAGMWLKKELKAIVSRRKLMRGGGGDGANTCSKLQGDVNMIAVPIDENTIASGGYSKI